MPILGAKGKIKSASFHAVITRADGTKKDLGIIARYERNPIKRLYYKITDYIKKFKEKR